MSSAKRLSFVPKPLVTTSSKALPDLPGSKTSTPVTATQTTSNSQARASISSSSTEQKDLPSPKLLTTFDHLKDSPSLASANSISDSSDEDPTKRRRRPVLDANTPQVNPNRHGRFILNRPKGLSEFDDNEPESATNEYASGNIGFRTRRLSKLVPDTLAQSTKPALGTFEESNSQEIQEKSEFASGFRQRSSEPGKRVSLRPQAEGASQSKLQPSNDCLNQADKKDDSSKSGKSASGVSAIDKLDLILSETRSASKSFAKDVLKSPARVLPAKFMDQYLKRTSVLESDTAAPAQNDHTANPDNTDVVKKRDILEERTSSEAIDFQAQKTLRSRHLWRLAWNGVTIGRWFIRFYYEMRAREASMKRATVMEAEGVAFLLSSQMAKPDMVLAAKLKELTSSPERSEADVEALERILSIRQRAFGRFTTDQRLKFCRILKYEHHTADRIVVREGHVSWAFYFILSGQVEIFKVKNGLKYRLNVMNAGASFGDRTMNMLNDKRTASVATTTETELIRIDKSDFFDITNVRDEKGLASRSAKLLQVPHFASAPGGFVERITPFVQIITFEPGEQIVNEGSQNYKLFWLVKGTCHCIKILPLVKRLMNANYAGKTYKVIPNNPGMVLEKNDEAIREQVNIQEMEIGSHFPDLPLPRGAKPMEEVLYVNKREYMEQIKKEDPTEDSTKAFVSIIAKTKVEVACVNQTDYVEFANNDMILSIINSKNIFRVPIAQLQDSYLEKRQWVSYKKKLVNEVTSKDAKAR